MPKIYYYFFSMTCQCYGKLCKVAWQKVRLLHVHIFLSITECKTLDFMSDFAESYCLPEPYVIPVIDTMTDFNSIYILRYKIAPGKHIWKWCSILRIFSKLSVIFIMLFIHCF